MHIEGIELLVASDVIPVGMGIEQKDRQGSDAFRDIFCVADSHAGIDQQSFFRTGQKKETDTSVFYSPTVFVHLNNFVAHN